MTSTQKSLSPEDLDKKFIRSYDKICKKYGRKLQVTPAWIRDQDGSYKLQIRSQIARV